MRKFYIILIWLICLLFSSFHSKAQFFNAGLNLGVNGSQITGDNMIGFDKGGINSGIFIEHKLLNNERICLRMSINYTQKGSRRIIDQYQHTAGKWDIYRADYLEIPFTFNFHVYKQWGAMGGLAFGFNVNEKYIPRDGTDFTDFNLAKKTELSSVWGIYYRHNSKFEFFFNYQSSVYNFSTASNTPFWIIWGDVRKGYIHVLTSAGLRFYFLSK